MASLDREKKEIKKASGSNSAVRQIIGAKKPKKEYVYRSYYLEKHHVKALDFEKAKTGKDLSQIVREALDQYFGEELEQYKD